MARVLKLSRGDGYGFHLASENKAQFIRKVEENSPGDKAGLRDGDRLIGVNNINVIGLTHKDVVNHIVQSGNSVELTIISPNAGNLDISLDKNAQRFLSREARLYKQPSGFGFVLHSERIKSKSNFYLNKIDENGSAHIAGVYEDDRLLAIDGVFVTDS